MFFFANYEGIRSLAGETVIGFVPNDNTRRGVVPCAYAPDLPCNSDGTATVPVNFASQAILKLYPEAGSNAVVPGSPLATVSLQGSQPANEDYGNIRWDYHASEKASFFSRYIIDNGSLTDPFASTLGLYPEQSRGRNQYLTLGYTTLINPSVVNDARFSFARTNMRAFTSVSNPALQFFAFYGEDRQDGNINLCLDLARSARVGSLRTTKFKTPIHYPTEFFGPTESIALKRDLNFDVCRARCKMAFSTTWVGPSPTWKAFWKASR